MTLLLRLPESPDHVNRVLAAEVVEMVVDLGGTENAILQGSNDSRTL